MTKFIINATKYDGIFLFETTNKWFAVKWLETALMNISGFSLIDELNKMQLEVFDSKTFENKDQIPIYFINLAIKEFNLEIREE